MKEGEKFKVTRYIGDKKERISIQVPLERPVTIMLNGEELVTFLATPLELKELAIGYLFSEGFIAGLKDLTKLDIDNDGYIWVKTAEKINPESKKPRRKILTSGCGQGFSFSLSFNPGEIKKIKSALTVSREVILDLMKETLRQADIHKVTGGVHVSSLGNASGDILSLHEDIGRHNTIDKAIGDCILKGIPFDDKILCTSGRIASEMMFKAAIAGIPIVVSHTSPTDVGVKMGEKYGVTVVGYVRAGKMTVYTHPLRLAD